MLFTEQVFLIECERIKFVYILFNAFCMIGIERVSCSYKELQLRKGSRIYLVQEYAECLLAINHRIAKDFSDISASYIKVVEKIRK